MIDGYIAVEREDAGKFCPHLDVTVSNKIFKNSKAKKTSKFLS